MNNPNCLQLNGSRMCPSFGNFSVFKGYSIPGRAQFNTVADFDSYIQSRLLTSPSGAQYFMKDQNCQSLPAGFVVPNLQSLWCAAIVDMSKRYNCNIAPMQISNRQLCKASAQAAVNAISRVVNDPAYCVRGINRNRSEFGDIEAFLNIGASQSADCITSQPGELGSAAGGVNGSNGVGVNGSTGGQGFGSNGTIGVSSLNPSPTASLVNPTASAAPSPSSSASASAATTSTGSLSPLVFAGIIGAIALLIILIVGAVLYMRRNKKRPDDLPAPSSRTSHPKSAPHDGAFVTKQVIFDYAGNHSDELSLTIGDQILVKKTYDDGWGFGFNNQTKEEGAFPLACVSSLDKLSEPRDSWTVSKRMSSYTLPSFAN